MYIKRWDVDLILPQENNVFNVISSQYDVIVAKLYSTFFSKLAYSKAKKNLYLVKNYGTNFCWRGNYFRSIAGKTYSSIMNI